MQDAFAARAHRLGARRRPGPPGRVADDRRPRGGRSTCSAARRGARGAAAAAGRRRPCPTDADARPEPATAIPDDRLRLIVTCCHPALDRTAQVALTLRLRLRAVHGRGRPRVPGPRADDGRADHPRQEEDRRPRGSPTGCPPAAELPERLDAVLDRRPSALHHRAHGAGRRPSSCAATWSSGRWTWPGCCGGCCPTDPAVAGLLGAAAAHRRPARDPAWAPTAGCCCSRTRTARRWDLRRDPGGRGAGAGGAARGGRRAGTRCRPPSPPCTPRRRPGTTPTGGEIVALYDVLGAGLAVAGGRAQPRGRASASPGARQAGLGALTRWPGAAAGRLRATCPRPGPTSCGGWAVSTRRARRTSEALQLTGNDVEREFLDGRLGELAEVTAWPRPASTATRSSCRCRSQRRTRIERTRNVSSSTPNATAKPISARNTIGSTPSTTKVAASTSPAEVITPPVTASPRRMPSRVPCCERLLPHPGHQEDVVVDAQRDQEHEREQRERRVGAGEVEHVVEDERADAQRGARTTAPR